MHPASGKLRKVNSFRVATIRARLAGPGCAFNSFVEIRSSCNRRAMARACPLFALHRRQDPYPCIHIILGALSYRKRLSHPVVAPPPFRMPERYMAHSEHQLDGFVAESDFLCFFPIFRPRSGRNSFTTLNAALLAMVSPKLAAPSPAEP